METKEKPKLDTIIVKSIADGVAAGVVMFLTNNRVNTRPGPKSKQPGVDFTLRLMAEYDTSGKSEYPFPNSLKQTMDMAIAQGYDNFKALYDNEEVRNLEALCRVIGSGETARFLENNRLEAIKLANDIRGA